MSAFLRREPTRQRGPTDVDPADASVDEHGRVGPRTVALSLFYLHLLLLADRCRRFLGSRMRPLLPALNFTPHYKSAWARLLPEKRNNIAVAPRYARDYCSALSYSAYFSQH